jgi:hypothetical protein
MLENSGLSSDDVSMISDEEFETLKMGSSKV